MVDATTPATVFAGQLGYLTPEQEKVFEEFKRVCAERGGYTPAEDAEANGGGKLASHDDILLIRFLRARKFVIEDAFQQFSQTEKWRIEENVDELYEHFDVEEYERCLKLHPQWTGRCDRDGMPLYVYRISEVSGPNLAEYTAANNKLQRLAMLYENVTQFVIPVANAVHIQSRNITPALSSSSSPLSSTNSSSPSTPPPMSPPNNLTSISSMTIITDIADVGLWTFWSLKGHMTESAKIATDRYPETLMRQFIINAPPFFGTVWGWIKKWFDPVTTSKITVLPGSLSKDELRQKLEVYIAPENLPKKYGGELEWEYGNPPMVDPKIKDLLGEDMLADGGIKGPIRWIVDQNGTTGNAVQVGKVAGKSRRSQPPSRVD